jgi:predicted 3-demethylubiquinone-9 3-methyltransferase (glyoxalase superfamily)
MTQLAVSPFVMFQGDGSSALEFYKSVFPDFEMNELVYYGSEGPGKEGSIKRARFPSEVNWCSAPTASQRTRFRSLHPFRSSSNVGPRNSSGHSASR